MAITILEQPESYVRAYDTNTAYYKIVTNNYAQTNFSFIIKIYDDASTLLGTIKLLPNATGYAWYNPTGYISNYLTSDVDINSDTLVDCTNSYGTYRLDFYEQYGDPIVEYTGATISSSKFYYNGCQIYENWDYYGGIDYWIVSNGSTNAHTLSPTNTYWLDSDEKMWLYFITSGNTAFDMEINFYDSDGLSIFGSQITYPISPSGNTMYSVGAGPSNMPSGSTPSNWSYYTINFYNIGNDYFGTNYPTVYRKDKCKKDWTEVYWLDEHGGWSNYTFNKRSYDDYKIGRNTFDKFLDYGYSTTSTFTPQRQTTQYNTEIDYILTLNTDWINEDENKLIKSLIFSPDVRIVQLDKGINKLIHYNITNSDFRQKNKADDGLYQYEIKFVPSHKKVIQKM